MFAFTLFCALTDSSARGEVGDAELIAAAQRGSEEAFTALHIKYYSRIYRLAFLKTSNVADAEDVASETFVRAFAKIGTYRTPDNLPKGATPSFYPWLHRIAIHLIVDNARQRPAAGIVSLDESLSQGVKELLADRLTSDEEGISPQELVERHEVQELVRAAIAALPEDQSDVVIFRFLGDLSTREIAPLLNRSESAVKSLLHRAVVALRVEITRRLDTIERLEIQRGNLQAPTEESQLHVRR